MDMLDFSTPCLQPKSAYNSYNNDFSWDPYATQVNTLRWLFRDKGVWRSGIPFWYQQDYLYSIEDVMIPYSTSGGTSCVMLDAGFLVFNEDIPQTPVVIHGDAPFYSYFFTFLFILKDTYGLSFLRYLCGLDPVIRVRSLYILCCLHSLDISLILTSYTESLDLTGVDFYWILRVYVALMPFLIRLDDGECVKGFNCNRRNDAGFIYANGASCSRSALYSTLPYSYFDRALGPSDLYCEYSRRDVLKLFHKGKSGVGLGSFYSISISFLLSFIYSRTQDLARLWFVQYRGSCPKE